MTYIGHATLLLQFGTASILTDPNFDKKLGFFLPRVSAPGIEMSELPRISAILLTHAHADHLSFKSLAALPRDIPIYAPPIIAEWLQREGFRTASGVEPEQRYEISGVAVTAMRARHMGARYGLDRWRGAAQMYLMDDGTRSILFTGDTAITPDASALARTIRPRRVDIALLPIGYAPRWKQYLFRRGHLTPADSLTLFEQIECTNPRPFPLGDLSSRDFGCIRCDSNSSGSSRALSSEVAGANSKSRRVTRDLLTES